MKSEKFQAGTSKTLLPKVQFKYTFTLNVQQAKKYLEKEEIFEFIHQRFLGLKV